MDIESDEEQGGVGGDDDRFSSIRSKRGDDEGKQSRDRSRPSSRPSSSRATVSAPVHDPVGNGHFEDEKEADDLLEDECCYNVFVSLRGRTPGRKMKRTLFKFHIAQLICGFSIFAIACYESMFCCNICTY
jgi:hypothetical protein